MLVGMHYKVWWHYKETDEVARANLSLYKEASERLDEKGQLEYIFEEVIDDVKMHYNPEKYNLKIEIKAVRINNEARPHETYPIVTIGDPTKIEEDIQKWGY
jgi:hypothetical protein